MSRFGEEIDKAIEWRLQELSILKMELGSIVLINKPITQKSLLTYKSMVLLLYSHFEGSIKDIFEIYIEYINENIQTNIFDERHFFTLSLLMHKFRDNKELKHLVCNINCITKMYANKKISFENFLKNVIFFLESSKNLKNESNQIYIQNLIDIFNNKNSNLRLEIQKNIIPTESNIGYEQYIKILDTFYIKQYNKEVSLKQKMNGILKERNIIAHGERRFNKIKKSNIEEYIIRIEMIINVIDDIKRKVLERLL